MLPIAVTGLLGSFLSLSKHVDLSATHAASAVEGEGLLAFLVGRVNKGNHPAKIERKSIAHKVFNLLATGDDNNEGLRNAGLRNQETFKGCRVNPVECRQL